MRMKRSLGSNAAVSELPSQARDFAARLALVLKAINLSRSQLASQVGVDKSVISRWMSGKTVPNGNNLARISEVVARQRPGFNSLHWERPHAEFERALGLAPVEVKPPVGDTHLGWRRGEPAAPPAARRSPPSRKIWFAAAVVTAALLVLSGVFVALDQPPAAPRAAPPPVTTLAVLPFANLSGDKAKDYFSDGFTEEVQNQLAKVPGLDVTSRTDTFAYKDKAAPIAAVARDLRVGSVLEGSVRQEGTRIRISAELIGAANGKRLWVNEYDRDVTDILKVQDEIARAITLALTQKLTGGDDGAPPSINPAVYKDYLQGLAFARVNQGEAVLRALTLLQSVTKREPNFAPGFAALGSTWDAVGNDDATRKDAPPAALAAYRRALDLDPSNRIALSGYAFALATEWRWDEASKAAYDAYERKQDDRGLLAMSTLYDTFALFGPEEHFQRRYLELQPTNVWQIFLLAYTVGEEGRYAEMLKTTNEGLALSPDSSYGLAFKCTALTMLGRFQEAIAIRESLRSRLPAGGLSEDLVDCATIIAARQNDIPTLQHMGDTLAHDFPGKGGFNAFEIAFVYQQAGDFTSALDWYQKSVDRRERYMPELTGVIDPSRLTPRGKDFWNTAGWKALWARPELRAWTAAREHAKERFTSLT